MSFVFEIRANSFGSIEVYRPRLVSRENGKFERKVSLRGENKQRSAKLR